MCCVENDEFPQTSEAQERMEATLAEVKNAEEAITQLEVRSISADHQATFCAGETSKNNRLKLHRGRPKTVDQWRQMKGETQPDTVSKTRADTS